MANIAIDIKVYSSLFTLQNVLNAQILTSWRSSERVGQITEIVTSHPSSDEKHYQTNTLLATYIDIKSVT